VRTNPGKNVRETGLYSEYENCRMNDRDPIQVSEDLTLRVGREPVTRLTTSEALQLAEVLVRKSMRRMLDEEAGLADSRVSG
jgi:hypothetical protein